MNIFVFDIETVPDLSAGRKLHNLADLSDEETLSAMTTLQREKTGSEFMPLFLQQVIAISIVLRTQDKLKVWSLGNEDSLEKELIQRFFKGIETYTPNLVSWNGSGFDLPVLHYRALLHGVVASQYWETGDAEQNFRWNNYINRYHYRHLDLMDVLASYQMRAYASLDNIATLLGLPGKMGMSGDQVWSYYQQGDIQAIRNYCETDVLNTYLVYLRFELMRGKLNELQYQEEYDKTAAFLEKENQPHFSEFLKAWRTS